MVGEKEVYQRRFIGNETLYVRRRLTGTYSELGERIGISADEAFDQIGGNAEMTQEVASKLLNELGHVAEIKFLDDLKASEPTEKDSKRFPWRYE